MKRRTIDEVMAELEKLPHDLLFEISFALGLNLHPWADNSKVRMEIASAVVNRGSGY